MTCIMKLRRTDSFTGCKLGLPHRNQCKGIMHSSNAMLTVNLLVIRRVPYLLGLLRYGLGVPEHRIRVGSGREPWTLGAALAEGAKAGAGGAHAYAILPRPAVIALGGILLLAWMVFLWWTLKARICVAVSFSFWTTACPLSSLPTPSKVVSFLHQCRQSHLDNAENFCT